MKLVNEASRQLRGRSNRPDSDYDTLRDQLVNLRKVLGQVKPGQWVSDDGYSVCVCVYVCVRPSVCSPA